jgi:hypothetical protein
MKLHSKLSMGDVKILCYHNAFPDIRTISQVYM